MVSNKDALLEEKIKLTKLKQEAFKEDRLERREERLEKKRMQQKKKKRKAISKTIGQFGKKLTKKVKSKRILKKTDLRVNIPYKKTESVLGDDNRFFQGEYEQERRNMFLQ